MSKPSTQYSGPVISSSVDWEVRRHLQILYSKDANKYQGISLLSDKVNKLQTGGSSTTIFEGGFSGGSSSVADIGISVNNQSGVTSYATMNGDNDVLILFADAGAIAVSLTTQTPPWSCFIFNDSALGGGTVTLTPATGTINGGATLTIMPSYWAIVAFDGTNWFAATLPVVPEDTPAVTSEWLNSYDAATGDFTQTQPAFSDISGNLATSQLPSAGISTTIVTAQLTTLGTQGSMTFVNGILTAQVQAT